MGRRGLLTALVATALLAPPAVASRPGPAAVVPPVPVPASIPADCSRDVTAELNAFLAALPVSGATVSFPRRGCYRTDREIVVSGKSLLTLIGNGTVLRRVEPTPEALLYPRHNRHFSVQASDHVVVWGLEVSGLNTVSDLPYLRPDFGAYRLANEFEHGVAVLGSTNVSLRELAVRSVFGDGIYLGPLGLRRTSRVAVSDVLIDRNGRQGIAVLADQVLVDGALVLHSRRSGIDIEPDLPDQVVGDVEVRNSTIHSWLLAFASGGRGSVDDVFLHHNTVTRTGVPFVYARSTLAGHSRARWRVTDNVVTAQLGSPAAAVLLVGADDAVVARNVVPVATTQSRLALDLRDGSDAVVVCNHFPGAGAAFTTADASSRQTEFLNSVTDAPPACLSGLRPGAPALPADLR